MESGTKRKRDLDCPRITFHAPGKTFDRLFKEDSLGQLQEVARKKLGLQSDALVKLTQIRGATDVDLEDEDDFDAFYNAIHSTCSASIRITILGNDVVKNTGKDKSVATPARKKRKLTAPQISASNAIEATPVTTIPGLSGKRAASPPSEATDSSKDSSEPPSKRVRISSPHPPAKSLEKRTAHAHESANAAPTNGMSSAQTGTTVSGVLTSPPMQNSSTPVQKSGTDAKKPTKPKSKKSLGASSSSLGVKTRDEVLEEQAKAEQELKKKEKSEQELKKREKSEKKERKKAGDDSATLASTKGGDGPKGTSSKSKKSKASEAPKSAAPASGKPKKAVKSKAQVQEAASDSVDSETNDVLDVDAQPKEALADISRSIIEKYLTPQVSTIEVGSKGSASVAQNIPKVPTCPYCGKSLTHDRSHCPLLRTKLTHTIEQRLGELRTNEDEDPEVLLNAISALEAALQRRRSVVTNKEQNATVSRLSIPPQPKPTLPMIISAPTPLIKSTSRSRSSTSSESSSEDDSADEDDSPKNGGTSRINAQPRFSVGPSASTSRLLTPQSLHDDTNTEDSSESDTSSSETAIKPKAIPFRPPRSDDSESSSSSEDEQQDVVTTLDRGFPTSQPARPNTLPSMNDGIGYNDKDLEALIRGPSVSFKSTDLPSSDSSEDEEPESVQLDNESEQELNSRSQKTGPPFAIDSDSGDDDMEGDDEIERQVSRNSLVNLAPPVIATSNTVSRSADSGPIREASQEKGSFQQINQRTRSEVIGGNGNNTFEEVPPPQKRPLGLVRKELTPPSTAQKSSDAPTALTLRPQSHDHLEEEQGEPVEESTLQTNGTIADVMQQDPEREQASAPPDLVGSTDAPDVVPDAEPRSTIEAVEDNEGPSTSPPHTQEKGPREEPVRETTPKPAMIQRMRSRAIKTPSMQKQATPLSLNQAAVAKPSMTTRAQSKSTNKNQSNEPYQNEDDGDAEPVTSRVKAAPKKDTAGTTKTPLPRTKITVEKESNGGEGGKEPDPQPRRSQRMSSKPPSIAPEVLRANLQPLARKTRSSTTVPNHKEGIESHQPSSKKPPRVVQQSNKAEANVTVNSSLPLPESKDSDTVVSGSQPGGPKALCPPSPPVSLDAWETLIPETPVGTTQSDSMIDELHSDTDPIPFPLKPQHRRKTSSFGRKESFPRIEQILQDAQEKEEQGGKGKEKPLFIPSESQTVFPYSQFQSDSQEHTDGKSSDSEEEEEVLATVVNKVPRSQSQPSTYRRLSDMAGRAAELFTPKVLRRKSSILQNSARGPNTRKDRLGQLYGKMGKKNSDDIESDDDSGHDSDSNSSKTSHIPKSRKAGAAPKGRMSIA